MKSLIFFLLIIVSHCSLAQENDTLYVFYDETTELPGFANAEGDTVIPAGIYQTVITEKFIDYLLVIDTIAKAYAIDRNLDTLYEVYWYDNGPDYIEEGLFRIVENGKIGYANEKGEVVLRPIFGCAGTFQDGFARVAYECERFKEGEFTVEQSDEWLLIDHEGNETEIDQ